MATPTSPSADRTGFALPSKHLPAVVVRDMPEPPVQTWKIIGPGVVGAGIGLASGEFILWPYIASQIGLVFLWGAAIGVLTQWFINMEIERYTLATGETALTGFSRMWRHRGLVFVVMTSSRTCGRAGTSSAALFTYLFGGGSVNLIAIVMLLVIGASLTLAPVVYTAVERVIFLEVAAIVVFVVIAAVFAITAATWQSLPSAVTSFGRVRGRHGTHRPLRRHARERRISIRYTHVVAATGVIVSGAAESRIEQHDGLRLVEEFRTADGVQVSVCAQIRSVGRVGGVDPGEGGGCGGD